jgi:hypothetical protein
MKDDMNGMFGEMKYRPTPPVGKHECKRPLERLRLALEDVIRMDLR